MSEQKPRISELVGGAFAAMNAERDDLRARLAAVTAERDAAMKSTSNMAACMNCQRERDALAADVKKLRAALMNVLWLVRDRAPEKADALRVLTDTAPIESGEPGVEHAHERGDMSGCSQGSQDFGASTDDHLPLPLSAGDAPPTARPYSTSSAKGTHADERPLPLGGEATEGPHDLTDEEIDRVAEHLHGSASGQHATSGPLREGDTTYTIFSQDELAAHDAATRRQALEDAAQMVEGFEPTVTSVYITQCIRALAHGTDRETK